MARARCSRLRRPGGRPLHQPDQPIWKKATTSPSTTTGARIFDAARQAGRAARSRTVAASAALVEKGNYRHFMEKEIHDQPDGVPAHPRRPISTPLAGTRRDPRRHRLRQRSSRIQIVACGTAFYAGQIGQYAVRAAGRPARATSRSPRSSATASPALTPGHAGRRRLASRARPPTPWRPALVQGQGPEDRRRGQRPRHRPWPARPTCLWPTHCRAGDRRGLDQGLHRPGRGADWRWPSPPAGRAAGSTRPRRQRLVKVLLEAPRLIAEAMQLEDGGQRPSPRTSPRPATCSTWAAGRCSRWPWKAR